MIFDEFAASLRVSRSVVFFTGAGISTESGVPDFRSPGGVWTKYQPVLFEDFPRKRVRARAALAFEKSHLRAFQNGQAESRSLRDLRF